MKFADSWYWPDNERHLLEWIANPKARMILNGRPAYQGRKQALALANVPADRRRVAIDVGGHVGLWSYNLAYWFEHVEAFEPVAAHRECFLKNLSDPEGGRVNLNAFALGDHEDTISIHTADTSSGDSWVKGKGDIPMKTLDSFGFENVDFIKIDCEGYEEFVLRGGEALIMRCKPVIVVEQKRDMAAKFGLKPLGAVAWLQARGYRIAKEISGDYIVVPA